MLQFACQIAVDALSTSVCFEEVCARHMNICTNVAVTKFQKSCKHTVSVQLRAFDVNVGFENFLQHFCLSHLGQSKCERKQQLSTSFLPSALLQWSIKSYVNVANAVFPENQRDGVILAWPFYQGEIGFN